MQVCMLQLGGKEVDVAYKCNVCHPLKPIQKSQICSVWASLCRGLSTSFCHLTVCHYPQPSSAPLDHLDLSLKLLLVPVRYK